MRRRTKRTIGLALVTMLALLVAWQVVAFADVGNGFEDDDGNLVDDPATGIDWNSFATVSWQPSPTTTPTREADKTVSGFKFKGIEDWQATGADSAFAGGTKQDNSCAKTTDAKAPNKDDLKRIYLASSTAEVEGEDHVFLDLAWARIPQNTTSASAHVAFEFNKGTTACPAPNPDGLVERTVGDILIVYDFEGGSSEPVLTLREWVDSGACEVGSNSPPCWGPATNLTASGFAEAKVNVGTSVTDALAPPALTSTTGTSVNQTLGDSEFGEAGIDLTAAGVLDPDKCESFGSAFGVSRSSGNSAQAQMKDLVGPADFTLQSCGEIIIKKRTDPRGENQNFSFTSNIAGSELDCTADETPASFTLNDDAGVDNSTNTETCTNVPAGSYTVTEGADPAGFAFKDLSCTASGQGTSATPTSGNATKVASITMAGGGSVTCVYTNEPVRSKLSTAQSFIPQDKATLGETGDSGTYDGRLDFKLYRSLANCETGKANPTASDSNAVYQENVDVPASTAPGSSFSTNNPGGTSGYTIEDGTKEGNYVWGVFYTGDSKRQPVLSCVENSTVSITNGGIQQS